MSLPLVSAGWDLSQVTEGEDVAWAAIFEEVVCNCRRATTSDPSFLFLHERPPSSPCSLGLFLERWWVLTCCVASCGWTRRQPNWANYVSFFPADEVTTVTVFTHKIFRQHLSPWHKSTSIMLIFFSTVWAQCVNPFDKKLNQLSPNNGLKQTAVSESLPTRVFSYIMQIQAVKYISIFRLQIAVYE